MPGSRREQVLQGLAEARGQPLPDENHPCFTGPEKLVTCACAIVFRSKVVYSMARRQAISAKACPSCGKRDASTRTEE